MFSLTSHDLFPLNFFQFYIPVKLPNPWYHEIKIEIDDNPTSTPFYFIIFKKSIAFSFLTYFLFQINAEVRWELQLLLPLGTDSTFLKWLLFSVPWRNCKESLSCSPGAIYCTYKELFTFHAIHSIRDGKPQLWILKQDLSYNL